MNAPRSLAPWFLLAGSVAANVILFSRGTDASADSAKANAGKGGVISTARAGIGAPHDSAAAALAPEVWEKAYSEDLPP